MGEDLPNGSLKLDELVGQEPIKQRLSLIAQTFSGVNGDAMPRHMLFDGPSGTGRLAFAEAFADSIHATWLAVDARSFAVQGDLTAIMTNFKRRTVLCIKALEEFKPSILMCLTEACQTGKLRIYIGQGPAVREHFMDLHPFTAIFLTNNSSRIPESIRNATAFRFAFQRYSAAELENICLFHAERAGLTLNPDEVRIIGENSSGTVGNIAKVLTDVASFTAASNGSAKVAHALSALGIVTNRTGDRRDLQELSGIEFEHRICGLLSSMGFQTEMTRASGDGGIDIVAHLDQPIVGGRYLFQCKRFTPGNLVSAPNLRDFFGALKADPTAIKGVFVTTSSFTEQARQFAQQVGIELIDSIGICELLTKYQS